VSCSSRKLGLGLILSRNLSLVTIYFLFGSSFSSSYPLEATGNPCCRYNVLSGDQKGGHNQSCDQSRGIKIIIAFTQHTIRF